MERDEIERFFGDVHLGDYIHLTVVPVFFGRLKEASGYVVGLDTLQVFLNPDAPLLGLGRRNGTVPYEYSRIKSHAVIKRGIVSRVEITTVSLEGI